MLTLYMRVNEGIDDVFGYVLDTNATIKGNWNLPVPFKLPKFGSRYTPMPNNSVFAIKQEDTSGIWNIYSSELPRLLKGKNKFENHNYFIVI